MKGTKPVTLFIGLFFACSNLFAQNVVIGAKTGFDILSLSLKYQLSGDIGVYKSMSAGLAFDLLPNQRKEGEVRLKSTSTLNDSTAVQYTSSTSLAMMTCMYKSYGLPIENRQSPVRGVFFGFGLSYGFATRKYTLKESYDKSIYASPLADKNLSQFYYVLLAGYEIKLSPKLFLPIDMDVYGLLSRNSDDLFEEDKLKTVFAYSIGLRYAFFDVKEDE